MDGLQTVDVGCLRWEHPLWWTRRMLGVAERMLAELEGRVEADPADRAARERLAGVREWVARRRVLAALCGPHTEVGRLVDAADRALADWQVTREARVDVSVRLLTARQAAVSLHVHGVGRGATYGTVGLSVVSLGGDRDRAPFGAFEPSGDRARPVQVTVPGREWEPVPARCTLDTAEAVVRAAVVAYAATGPEAADAAEAEAYR